MASFGAAVAISAAPAWASVTTNSYTIGTPGSAFTTVSVTPTGATSLQPQAYVITAVAPSAIPAGDSITVTDSAGNVPVSGATNVSLVDENAANCLQAGTNGGLETRSGLVIILDSICNIAAGDTIKIDLTVTDPTSNFSFSVASAVNGTAVSSNSVTINAIPPTASASLVTVGSSATYTIAGIGTAPSVPWNYTALTAVANTSYSITALVVESRVTVVPSTANSIGWYGSANGAGYSVTYTPSGGSLTTDTVQSATVSSSALGTNNVVSVLLASGIPAGSNITLTAEGLNPSTANVYPVTVTPEWTNPPTSTPTTSNQAPYTNAVTEVGVVTLGTSVAGVTVTPSTTLASASATYTVGFKSTSGVPAGGYICLAEASSSFVTLAVRLTDTTSGAQFVLPSADVADVACGTSTFDFNSLQITLPTGEAIIAGDQVTVTGINVNNPTMAGTYSDFAVSTSVDTVAVDAPAYQISASSNVGVSVAVSPTSPGSLATYTISGMHASAAIVSGATITIQPSGTGTVLPDSASDYTLTDSTTTTGSGGLGLVSYAPATVTPPAAAAVTLSLPNAINIGDQLTITIDAVINPPLAGSSYSLSVANADIAGPAVVPFTIPGVPIIGTATAGHTQATVSFSAPASNGGGTITSYTVTATDSTTPANGGQSASGAASPITVTGLSAGDSYSFTVTATNGAGAGPASAASNTVVPLTTPFTNVWVTPTTAISGQSQSYVITMTAPIAMPNGDSITVTDSVSNAVVATTRLSSVSLVDDCFQFQSGGGSVATGALVITLDSTCNIAAGDTINIGLTVTDPTSNFSFGVASTVNGTAVSSNSVTINSIPPMVSASPANPGYGAMYTIAGIGTEPSVPWNSTALTVASVTEPATALTVESTVTGTPTTANSIGWYGSANGAGYSVTYTPSGGSLTTDTVVSATPSSTTVGGNNNNVVNVLLASGIPAGANITLTAEGLNPSTANVYPVTVTPEWTNPPTSTPTTSNQAPYTNAVTEVGVVTLGTSVRGVTVTPSPTLASTSATYTVGFTSTGAVPAGGYICLAEPNTSFSNAVGTPPSLAVLVTDTTWGTSGSQYVVPAADVSDTSCGTATTNVNSLQITLPTGEAINAGDQVTVTVIKVNNPTTVGTYSDFAVSTSTDTVAVDAHAYQIAVAPGAPIIGTATAGYAQASVNFTAPASNGASTISSYTVTATDSTTSANGGQSASGAASPITVTGLTPGDSYSFTVAATNGAGTGQASAASNAVVPFTIPGAPTIGTATAGTSQATVSFSAPASNGASTISTYTVTATDSATSANGGQSASGAASPITVTGLTPGDSYSFTVAATNGAGTGPASAASNTVVPAAPSPPPAFPAPIAAPTTTTTVPSTTTTTSTVPTSSTTTVVTTTTTRPPGPKASKPVIGVLSRQTAVSKSTARLRLTCTTACTGTVTLWYHNVRFATTAYHLAPGKGHTFSARLSARAVRLLGEAKGHILEVEETVTVKGGATKRVMVELGS
jgi:hypothetical protein